MDGQNSLPVTERYPGLYPGVKRTYLQEKMLQPKAKKAPKKRKVRTPTQAQRIREMEIDKKNLSPGLLEYKAAIKAKAKAKRQAKSAAIMVEKARMEKRIREMEGLRMPMSESPEVVKYQAAIRAAKAKRAAIRARKLWQLGPEAKEKKTQYLKQRKLGQKYRQMGRITGLRKKGFFSKGHFGEGQNKKQGTKFYEIGHLMDYAEMLREKAYAAYVKRQHIQKKYPAPFMTPEMKFARSEMRKATGPVRKKGTKRATPLITAELMSPPPQISNMDVAAMMAEWPLPKMNLPKDSAEVRRIREERELNNNLQMAQYRMANAQEMANVQAAAAPVSAPKPKAAGKKRKAANGGVLTRSTKRSKGLSPKPAPLRRGARDRRPKRT